MWLRLTLMTVVWTTTVRARAIDNQTVMASVAVDATRLVADLKSTDVNVRRTAAERISQLSGDLRAVSLELAEAAADEDEVVRSWIVSSLEEMGPPAAADVGDLANLLEHASDDVGYWAATLIGRLGKEALPVLPALVEALKRDRGVATRQRAAWALGKIGRKAADALPALERAAADAKNPRLARLAQQSIESIRK